MGKYLKYSQDREGKYSFQYYLGLPWGLLPVVHVWKNPRRRCQSLFHLLLFTTPFCASLPKRVGRKIDQEITSFSSPSVYPSSYHLSCKTFRHLNPSDIFSTKKKCPILSQLSTIVRDLVKLITQLIHIQQQTHSVTVNCKEQK